MISQLLLTLLCANALALPSFDIASPGQALASVRSSNNITASEDEEKPMPDDLNTGGIEEHNLVEEGEDTDEDDNQVEDRANYKTIGCGYYPLNYGYIYRKYTTSYWCYYGFYVRAGMRIAAVCDLYNVDYSRYGNYLQFNPTFTWRQFRYYGTGRVRIAFTSSSAFWLRMTYSPGPGRYVCSFYAY